MISGLFLQVFANAPRTRWPRVLTAGSGRPLHAALDVAVGCCNATKMSNAV